MGRPRVRVASVGDVPSGQALVVQAGGQGVAVEYGGGRVVVLGEAAMLSAQLHRFDGHAIGMNVSGYDNRQLALNIVHWLSRLI